jgi:hypothetical protein
MIPTEQKLHRLEIREYKKQLRHFLMTSRFNTDTWNQNENYRRSNKNIGCIYCSPDPISQHVPTDSIMFVLEMNNDMNSIMGIGMVRNRPIVNKHRVYDNGNYNRYVFTGNMRISRTDMTELEEQIMRAFDILCFTGNKHMKRGQGLKSFPIDILHRCNKKMDLVQFISNMFKQRITPFRIENTQGNVAFSLKSSH